MDEKKKEQLRKILLSHIRNLRGKKRYLPWLLCILLVIALCYADSFAIHRVSHETHQIVIVLILLVALSGGLILSKYEKTLKGNETDGEGTENLEIHHQNKNREKR